jgi:hypothetical protein
MKTKKHPPFPFVIKLTAMLFLGLMAFTSASAAGAGNGVLSGIPPLNKTMNAKYVNGIQSAKVPVANRLIPLNGSAQFPLSVIPQGSGSGLGADNLDGLDSSSFAFVNSSHALEIPSGGIKVSGAGAGTNTPAFIHVATASNIITTGLFPITMIDNSYTNYDPNAILIITPNVSAGKLVTHPVGVIYSSTSNQWAIYNLDLTSIPVNSAYNVLVIKP